MRKSKDLSACISFLEDLQRRGSVDPEKTEAVGDVIEELKRIRRKPILERQQQHEAIRRIVERLVKAFAKRD